MTILSIVANLMSAGYQSIRVQSSDPVRVRAFNTAGREVLLTISTRTGEISGTEYVPWTRFDRSPIPGAGARPADLPL